jgi:hypothetical protein
MCTTAEVNSPTTPLLTALAITADPMGVEVCGGGSSQGQNNKNLKITNDDAIYSKIINGSFKK